MAIDNVPISTAIILDAAVTIGNFVKIFLINKKTEL